MTMTPEQVLTRLIEGVATGDRPGLEAVLAGTVRLYALLPSRFVERVGPGEVATELLGWYDEVPQIVPVDTRVETVGDVWHAAFRFALRGTTPERVVEQHAYCAIAAGAITEIRLLCSGFRPAEPLPEGEPVAARRIDALGDSCATLTPRIAAALRELAPGDVLAVLTDDPSAPESIAAWSRLTGHQLVGAVDDPTGTRYYLRHA